MLCAAWHGKEPVGGIGGTVEWYAESKIRQSKQARVNDIKMVCKSKFRFYNLNYI